LNAHPPSVMARSERAQAFSRPAESSSR
jgi:hypothetical protein